ncbi:RteC domain-containing protein [Dysgonomonas sp.]|uniref:RteC domain-containing protein n=1 Tax=Dysgonomonas sp. TaxID=1891233 RepID=UPI003A84AFC2
MIDCTIDFVKSQKGLLSLKKINKKYSKYQWTADISNLVELAYAILEAECVNNGDAEIMAFVEFLGEMFNIKIGRCSDFYYKMRTKSGSRTAFLQKLIKVLEARMDRDDEKNNRK